MRINGLHVHPKKFVPETLVKRFLYAIIKMDNVIKEIKMNKEELLQNIKEGIAVALIFMFAGWAILDAAVGEEELVQKHCGHLTGAEYGHCQASIY